MKKLNKKICLSFFIFGIIIMYCSFAIAAKFAIGSSYSENSPLIMAPGEEKTTQFILQNYLGEGDLKVSVSLLKGMEIATLTDNNLEYTIPFRNEIPVNLKIKVPATAAEGSEYIITLGFMDITPSAETGTVTFASSSEVSMKVLVQKPPAPAETPKEKGNAILWVIAIIVVIAIILVIYLITKAKRK